MRTMTMKRCARFISRNLIEHQRLHRGPIFLPSTAAIHNRHSDNHTTTSWRQRSFRDKTTIRNLTTNSISTAETTQSKEENDSSSPIIQGTIPLHGEGIQTGQYAHIHRKFTQEDVNLFGTLSGDMNPVHFPPSTTTIPTRANQHSSSPPIVHGILLSSLFSTIFGTLIPGAIYRHQSLKFQNVVYVNEEVVGRVVVKKLRQVQRKGTSGGVLCTCDTSVVKLGNTDNSNDEGSKEETVCISGEAQVWLPDLQLVDECM